MPSFDPFAAFATEDFQQKLRWFPFPRTILLESKWGKPCTRHSDTMCVSNLFSYTSKFSLLCVSMDDSDTMCVSNL